MRNTSTAVAQRNHSRIATLPVSASRRRIVLEPEIRRLGEAAIRKIIAAEEKSEFPNRSAIANAKHLLADLDLLPPVAQVTREQFVIFAAGAAAVSRLIAQRLAERRPDVDSIAHASWLIADLGDLVEEELDRNA
jgi:hypothetical protein